MPGTCVTSLPPIPKPNYQHQKKNYLTGNQIIILMDTNAMLCLFAFKCKESMMMADYDFIVAMSGGGLAWVFVHVESRSPLEHFCHQTAKAPLQFYKFANKLIDLNSLIC